MKVYGKTNVSKVLTTIIICAISICAIILVCQFIKIGSLKSKKNQLSQANETLTQQIIDYDNQLQYVNDRETYLQDYAREVKNWGKADRTYYVSR